MKLSFKKRNGWILAIVAVALLGSMMVMPLPFRTQAAKQTRQAASKSIVYQSALQNYDIRFDEKSSQSQTKLASLRQQAGRKAQSSAARFGQSMAQAKENLAARVSGLRVEMNPAGYAPEVVGLAPTYKGTLTAPTMEARETAVRSFLAQNNELYGLTASQVAQLVTVADYSNPTGNLSWVEYEQRVGGIPVFQGYVRAALTKDGEIARTTGNLAPGLDYATMQTKPGLSAADAAVSAAKAIGVDTSAGAVSAQSVNGRATILSRGPFDENIKAELVYFPTEPGVATLAYSMTLWGQDADYYIIVDANDGQMLWRKNIRAEQTQSVTYNIYNDDSPAPFSPSTALPGSGAQGTAIARTDVTVINEMPPAQPFSSDPWLADGAGNVTTTGNNVDAGLDIDGTNGIDAGTRAVGAGRVLSFVYNPAPGIPAPGDAPTGAAYRNGIVTNIFFWTNRYHDKLYNLGFTEAARNFQTNNFGRGGTGNDFVRAEAQDSASTNNANFSTPADGSLPRMQMFIFPGPTPDRDGDVDAEIFIHELTHGVSNRLHANAAGLLTAQSGGMGEGWGDFYARCILSTAGEDVNGLYASGAYATFQLGSLGNDNGYYGIRRFPYAVKTTLGANGKPHYPLTFADIDPAKVNTTDGAFTESPLNFTANNGAAEVHNIGEIWCMMLLEVRARMINRLGWAVGNQRAMQIVLDAMKLEVASPTLVQARDAIIAADNAGFAGADVDDIWAGFATRGLGFGASVTGTSTVTESFLTPNLVLGTVTFSDAGGNNNGFADPGETLALTVPINNPLGATATGVTATVAGTTVNYGSIAGGATVIMTIPYTVPAATPCGASLVIPVDINSSIGPVVPSQTFTLNIGQPIVGFTETLDGVTAPALPAGWTTAHTGVLADWVTSTTTPSSAPNDAFSNEVTTVATSQLVTPDIAINSASAQLTFRNLYNLEFSGVTPTTAFDGMVLEIAIPGVAGGAFQDIVTAGGSFASNGYNKTMSTGFMSPLSGRSVWSGTSAGTTAAPDYITTIVNLPAAANGKLIKLKWLRGDDSSAVAVGVAGVRIDSLQITTGSSCSPVIPPVTVRHPADFDGDGKTDAIVFRPSEGKWYVRNSATNTSFSLPWGLGTDKVVYGDYDGDGRGDFATFRESEGNWYILNSGGPTVTIVGWGQAGDKPVPADYDGDGKTDVAVFRPLEGNWYIKKSSGGSSVQGWGNPTDALVPSDYDGDGKADIAVFRATEGNWYVLKSTGGSTVTSWGNVGDKAVPGDYDGDQKSDIAVFRPADGNWYIKKSTGGSSVTNWGNAADKPVAADYDGDGKFDIAIWREAEANFYIRNSATNTVSIFNLGTTGDIPVIGALIP
jgi:Fungalysin metallopeptidase (M36)/FG-GAP-like repeat/FG-GAP repeat